MARCLVARRRGVRDVGKTLGGWRAPTISLFALHASTLAAQRVSVAPDSTLITAWAVLDSIALVTPHAPSMNWFSSLTGTLAVVRRGATSPRVVADSLDRVADIAISPDGKQAALAMFDQRIVTMRYREAYTGGLRLVDIASGRDVTPDGVPTADAVRSVVYTPDGRFLLYVGYHQLPSTRTCPYVECGEDETTRHEVWLHRVDLRSGADRRVYRLGRDDMDDEHVDYAISPRADRMLVWSHKPMQGRAGMSIAVPVKARMIDAATGRPMLGFRPNALGMNATRLAISCGDDSLETRFVALSPNAGIVARGTERAVKLIDARTGARIVERVLSDRDEVIKLRDNREVGDSTQTVILNGHVADDSSLVLTTCRPGLRGSRVEQIELKTGARRTLYVTPELLRDAILIGDALVVRSDTAIWFMPRPTR